MNSTLMGFFAPREESAREALANYVIGGVDGGDLCVSNCTAWKRSKAGRERFERLGNLMREHQKEKAK